MKNGTSGPNNLNEYGHLVTCLINRPSVDGLFPRSRRQMGSKKRGAEFADPGSKKLSSVVREEQGTEE